MSLREGPLPGKLPFRLGSILSVWKTQRKLKLYGNMSGEHKRILTLIVDLIYAQKVFAISNNYLGLETSWPELLEK